jgi:PAS domain S-box-containing protein
MLRYMMTVTPDWIVFKDRESRVQLCSQAYCEHLGRPAEEIVGRDIFEWYPIAEAQRYRDEDIQVMEAGQPLVREHRLKSVSDGHYRWMEAIKTPVRNQTGAVVGLLSNERDITRLKRTEEELTNTVEELGRSNAELEQFAYVTSHDLQEPLRSISGYLALLQRRYEGRLDAEADTFITRAVAAVDRLQALIQSLLAYSRVGSRGKPFEPTDCEAVLQRTLTNLRAAISESGAAVTHDPLPTVMADGSQLEQVFQNLIGNAIKFRSDAVPSIHLGVEHCQNQERGEGRFSVSDNGIGIDPQYAERIFGIFQRLHTRSEYSGTGIGLSICQRIVERHGGRIWVASEPGAGAVFCFTIPE